MIYAVFIKYQLTGHVSVKTFDTAFDRGLFCIGLASQPVLLRSVDYQKAAAHV